MAVSTPLGTSATDGCRCPTGAGKGPVPGAASGVWAIAPPAIEKKARNAESALFVPAPDTLWERERLEPPASIASGPLPLQPAGRAPMFAVARPLSCGLSRHAGVAPQCVREARSFVEQDGRGSPPRPSLLGSSCKLPPDRQRIRNGHRQPLDRTEDMVAQATRQNSAKNEIAKASPKCLSEE
jgi:hypothetical protein